ncbi:MAG TPA: ABC transporter substrate-binding protein [Streptosporangiaceae bacterium]|nr:ABC transporter substrate-binding protein [Streptosporangiaceae bacterium]
MKLTRSALGAVAVCALALGTAACGGGSGPSHPGVPGSGSSAVLTMEGSPTGPIPRNFNPFSPTSASNILGSTALVYEPLIQYDLVKPGTTYPWLATGYSWSNGGKTITFTIRSGVRWSNGSPFSASDVAYTFNLLKKYPAINTNGLQITSASAPNATTAVISFSSPAYSELYYIAGSTWIVPQSVWSKIGNPSTYSDPNPIGTGPYVLSTYSPNGLTYTVNKHYWQTPPKVAKVEFPVYDSNTSANQALDNGNLDWAGNFVSNIKANFLDKSPHNHVWDAPLDVEALIPNLEKFPFNSLAVRQAVSEGINRKVIGTDGEDNQQPGATQPGALTGLTLPLQSSYLTSQTRQYTPVYSPSSCRATLQKAGWKMGSDGYFRSPSGQKLAFTILNPSAYTDFITDDQIMASELKSCGMDVTVQGDSVAAWTAALADGNFQAISHWGTIGPTPYYDYNNYLNDTLTAPIGKTATGDYERFYSPQAQSYLNSFAGTNNPAVQKADIVGLEKIVATQLPIIPLFYGVAWDEYTTTHFTGWPTPSNPYMTGQPEQPMNEVTLLHLKPVS